MNPNLTEEQITWRELCVAVYKRDRWRCRHCKSMSDGLTAHHIIFRSQGGKDELTNLICLCWNCHRAVHDRNLEIEIHGMTENDVRVVFIRKNGWSPCYVSSWD